jgi:hypothetical protein
MIKISIFVNIYSDEWRQLVVNIQIGSVNSEYSQCENRNISSDRITTGGSIQSTGKNVCAIRSAFRAQDCSVRTVKIKQLKNPLVYSVPFKQTLTKQEILGITNHLLSFDKITDRLENGASNYCACIRCRDGVFTEQFSSNNMGYTYRHRLMVGIYETRACNRFKCLTYITNFMKPFKIWWKDTQTQIHKDT